MERAQSCPGCGARVALSDGPVHAYIGASAGCWAVFGEVLAREYSEPGFFSVHHLTVDAYAAQHPGVSSPRAIRSVAVHLIALHLTVELGQPAAVANEVRRRAVKHGRFVWLDPPAPRYPLTILDVAGAADPREHRERVDEWAASVWRAWEAHHPTVRKWAAAAGDPGPARGRGPS